MTTSRLTLILVLMAGALPLGASAHATSVGSAPIKAMASVYAATPMPPVAQALPGALESTRALVLTMLAQGNLQAAIAAWEAHTGRTAPRAVMGLQAAFSKANQVAGACIRVARAVHEGFKALGLKPQVVRFEPPTDQTTFLAWEMQAGVARSTIQISDTGRHFAVQVGDRIYDAFTGPAGMLLADYLQRLHSPAGRPIMQTVEKLP